MQQHEHKPEHNILIVIKALNIGYYPTTRAWTNLTYKFTIGKSSAEGFEAKPTKAFEQHEFTKKDKCVLDLVVLPNNIYYYVLTYALYS
jgi:hypothetical protein